MLALDGGFFGIFAGDEIAVGEVGGGTVTTEEIIDRGIIRFQEGEEFVLDFEGSGVKSVIEIDAGLFAVGGDHQSVVGIGGHDAAADAIAQIEIAIGIEFVDGEAQVAEGRGEGDFAGYDHLRGFREFG